MNGLNIGVLAIQGDVAENIMATKMAMDSLVLKEL